jgi:hypothetical protein
MLHGISRSVLAADLDRRLDLILTWRKTGA